MIERVSLGSKLSNDGTHTVKSPLHGACNAGQLEIVKLLLERQDIEVNKAVCFKIGCE